MVSIVNNFTETANVFGQQYTQEEAASGSGIIVGKTDDELLIVSNNHEMCIRDRMGTGEWLAR